jgi:hypothetical protein
MTEPRTDLWTTGAAASGHRPAVPTGAVGRRPAARPGRPWWLVALVAVAAVAALLYGLVRSGLDQARVDAPSVPMVPTAVIPGAGAAAAPIAPVAGSLTAGSDSLFAAAAAGDRGLAALAGQTATGHAVPVLSVPADEGFWIGTGEADRVWVQFTSSGESAVTITPGQLLDLSGPVVPHGADFARKAGVAPADGAEQLTREGAHLEVDPSQVKVVGTR